MQVSKELERSAVYYTSSQQTGAWEALGMKGLKGNVQVAPHREVCEL